MSVGGREKESVGVVMLVVSALTMAVEMEGCCTHMYVFLLTYLFVC